MSLDQLFEPCKSPHQYRLSLMSEGEPAFFALFLLFAILVILGIAENLDWLPRLHGGYIIFTLKI